MVEGIRLFNQIYIKFDLDTPVMHKYMEDMKCQGNRQIFSCTNEILHRGKNNE